MTQARRRQRFNSPSQKRIGHSLQEIVFISFCFMGLYLFFSLITYNGLDPGISHSGQGEEIRNLGGIVGALSADLLFELFGYFAYLFPIMVAHLGWLIYQGRHHDILAEPRSLIVPGIGFVLTLSAGCGLAIVHFTAESALLPSHAGGILGKAVGNSLKGVFGSTGATLLLVALFFTGVTLLTGLSWLKLMDNLGFHTLRLMPVVQRRFVENIMPQVIAYLQWVFNLSGKATKVILKQSTSGAKTVYSNWKTRRTEWRKQQEEDYVDDDFYYEDEDEYFLKGENPQSETKESPPAEAIQSQPEKKTEKPLPPVEKTHLPLNLLDAPMEAVTVDTESLSQQLVEAFEMLQFKIEVKTVHPGPVLVGFEVQPITPIEINHLDTLSEELQKILKAATVQIVETSNGILGIEIPNPERQTIYLCELLDSIEYQDSLSPLTLALGKDVNGQGVIVDLSRVPHILMAGSNPEDKTLSLNTLLLSLLYKSSPQAMRLLLADNVTGDLSMYAEIPHLLSPIMTDAEQTLNVLYWCEQEMERRYRLMAEMGLRNIETYNLSFQSAETQTSLEEEQKSEIPLFYIVVVVCEIAELMKSEFKEPIEETIIRLAQKARAAGIHLVLATQYPSTNVITGLLKSNISTRIAFQVTNKTESRTILGQMGAENLLGEADMLYMTAGTGMPVRVHGSFVTESEVRRVVADLKKQAKPQYVSTVPLS